MDIPVEIQAWIDIIIRPTRKTWARARPRCRPPLPLRRGRRSRPPNVPPAGGTYRHFAEELKP